MPSKKNIKKNIKKIVINDYMQHWIHSTETGHIFKIVDGKDNVLEIECNWKTYRRKGRFYKI